MATLGSPASPSSPSRENRRRRNCARKAERFCCSIVTYFPLVFVYGLTTWAAWVEIKIGLRREKSLWTGYASSLLGLALYLLLNTSYTLAVFTDPGSPLNTKNGYSHLPTDDGNRPYTSFTVKSTGDIRFCKKCQRKKPDRAHHCSTCKRCVLKMDHHCPWLATCVGLRNYKLFLLFLIYTCAFCWLCLATTVTWLWAELETEDDYQDSLMPVNYILLAVLSGIIGLVLTGFTAWHIWLACSGQTTIESLEKVRYVTSWRNSAQRPVEQARNYLNGDTRDGEYGNSRQSFGDQLRDLGGQLREIHANALPGITRPEEGEERGSPVHRPYQASASPAHASLMDNYEPYNDGERDRYNDYLDEQDSESLPNAFDLGWRRNLQHVFGTKWYVWFLPVANTIGDGWSWEANPKWTAARDRIAKDRAARISDQDTQWRVEQRSAQNTVGGAGRFYNQQQTSSHNYRPPRSPRRGSPNRSGAGAATPMQSLSRVDSPVHDRSNGATIASENWNDLPDEYLRPGPRRKAKE